MWKQNNPIKNVTPSGNRIQVSHEPLIPSLASDANIGIIANFV